MYLKSIGTLDINHFHTLLELSYCPSAHALIRPKSHIFKIDGFRLNAQPTTLGWKIVYNGLSLVENSVTRLTKIQHKSVDFFVNLDVLIWVVVNKNVLIFLLI